jgi:hypothetical protein
MLHLLPTPATCNHKLVYTRAPPATRHASLRLRLLEKQLRCTYLSAFAQSSLERVVIGPLICGARPVRTRYRSPVPRQPQSQSPPRRERIGQKQRDSPGHRGPSPRHLRIATLASISSLPEIFSRTRTHSSRTHRHAHGGARTHTQTLPWTQCHTRSPLVGRPAMSSW